MTTARALLYARTIPDLRWQQVAYRPLRRVQRRLPVRLRPQAQGRPDGGRAPLAGAVAAWPHDACDGVLRRADAVRRRQFTFLNHSELLPAMDWQRRHGSPLWSYHLHYFDYAVDLARAYRLTGDAGYARGFEELAAGWIGGTVPGRGDGWDPYPTSLRVVNWIYALLLLGDAVGEGGRARIEGSLAAQAEYVARRLELHLLGNHLLKNLKALVVAGLYFSGSSADAWLGRGLRLLWRELGEQVLPDGGHYERSPMYHAIALADLLELVSLLEAAARPVPAGVRERLQAMTAALGTLSRPSGELHLFNDAAAGMAPGRTWLDGMARQVLGVGVPEPSGPLALPDAGYFGLADARAGDRLLVDCGVPGPHYQPGHAHCDLLSYELDLAGTPVVVDAGVSGYDGDPLREYARSTRAHNTVMIGGREQSEVWGTFRLARRARPLGARQELTEGGYRFEGVCSPFHARRAVHARTIERAGGRWIVSDRVQGSTGAPLSSFLHLHPDFTLERRGDHFVARSPRLTVVIEPFGVEEVRPARGERAPAQGWHCPEFGVALPACALELRVVANDGRPFGYHLQAAQL